MDANSAYEEPHTQVVLVDGVLYTVYNPETQYNVCSENKEKMEVAETLPVLLTRNHQLLIFGFFVKRSTQSFADGKLSSYSPSIF